MSVEPEVMVVSINLNSSTWGAINQHRHFCVSVLRADQMAIAERFAGRGGLKGFGSLRRSQLVCSGDRRTGT
ncbi:MAG: flavin reductase family protein [Mesorhizobium sp.]|nr:MAG: flavin reductase family protein [Mesorhizobium sp.]